MPEINSDKNGRISLGMAASGIKDQNQIRKLA